MNDVFVGAAEVSHKALPCFDGLAEEGTYFGGGHIVLGLALYFKNLDAADAFQSSAHS